MLLCDSRGLLGAQGFQCKGKQTYVVVVVPLLFTGIFVILATGCNVSVCEDL